MKVEKLISYLEEVAPPSLQEDYDNSGFLVGDRNEEIKGVLICLDVTEDVLLEAIKKGCNLIVAHHPVIFRGIKKLCGEHFVERILIQAIRHHLNIYAIHTNLDNILYRGVNSKIAEKLNLIKPEILLPKPVHEIQMVRVPNIHEVEPPHVYSSLSQVTVPVGSGLIAILEHEMEEMEFLSYLKKTMKTQCVRHTKSLNRKIKKVALCGGAGSFLLTKAIQAGADVFISGDFKYHEFFEADGKILIADIGHYESEQFTIELLYEIITKKFSNFACYFTKVITNPVSYL